MTITCSYAGCTVETTERCVLGNDSAECPQRDGAPAEATVVLVDDREVTGEADAYEVEAAAAELDAPVLEAPVRDVFRLELGGQLGFPAIQRIGSDRPLRMIGILGPPDSGKTAILVSLFLLLSKHKLARIRFRNSESLFALNDLSRGAREWDTNGKRLTTITDHTSLDDPRRPGFLHFRVHAEKLGKAVDLIFPDLPGEWSDNLIDKGYDAHLDFMKSARALWIFVDGSALIDPVRRQNAADRTRKLLSRIATYMPLPADAPILVVVTRRDEMDEVPEDQLELIKNEAKNRKLSVEIILVASVSSRDGIENGHGIEDLLEASLVIPAEKFPDEAVELPSPPPPPPPPNRQMLRYRSVAP